MKDVSKFHVAVALAILMLPPVLSGATVTTGPLVLVSSPDSPVPNDASCAAGQMFGGWLQRQSEVEPSVAVNPTNPLNIIASYQQDRFEGGAAMETAISVSNDGGETWTRTTVPYQACLGGKFDRATDPWVTFSPDGTAYQMSLVFSYGKTTPTSEAAGMAVSRSTDGGATWSAPVLQASQPYMRHPFFHDKNSITADPNDSRYVYSIWDNAGNIKQPAIFSRTTNGGASWEAARQIYNVNKDIGAKYASTIGNIVQVLPDGSLVAMMLRTWPKTNDGKPIYWSNDDTNFDIAVIRSKDHGRTWTPKATRVSTLHVAWVFDPEWGWYVRSGDIIPSIAVNPVNGYLYIVWQDLHTYGHSTIMISASRDGGLTWSAPQVASQTPQNVFNPQAMTPAVAVTNSGNVGVFYYDFRNDVDGDAPNLTTDAFLAVFSDDGSQLTFEDEVQLTDASFNMYRGTWASGLFLGDYMGLSADGDDLVAVFGITTGAGWWNYVQSPWNPNLHISDENRTDMVFRRISVTP